jgi:hypothetical protein
MWVGLAMAYAESFWLAKIETVSRWCRWAATYRRGSHIHGKQA